MALAALGSLTQELITVIARIPPDQKVLQYLFSLWWDLTLIATV